MTEIGNDAFSSCSNLISVSIPASVSTIGHCAFCNCPKLSSIEVSPENPNFTSLDGVLLNKEEDVLIAFPCNKADIYSIPTSVTTIGDNAFYACTNLIEVNITDNVATIGESSFSLCSSLTTLFIPDSVKTIGTSSFSNCSMLKELIIDGGNISSIEDNAFSGCKSLETLYYLGITDVRATGAFSDCESLESVCVPPSYPSTSFCGINITSESSICESFQRLYDECNAAKYNGTHFVQQKTELKQENKCYEVVCIGHEWILQPKWNVSDFENTLDCKKFDCESGTVSSICDSNKICVNNECIQKETVADNTTSVIFEMVFGTKVEDIDSGELMQDLEIIIGISSGDVRIGYEADDEGYVIRIIVFVDDVEIAKKIASAAENCTTA